MALGNYGRDSYLLEDIDGGNVQYQMSFRFWVDDTRLFVNEVRRTRRIIWENDIFVFKLVWFTGLKSLFWLRNIKINLIPSLHRLCSILKNPLIGSQLEVDFQ